MFGLNARVVLAAGAFAASLSYALVAGSATAGLRGAEEILQDEALVDSGIWQLPARRYFPQAESPEGTTMLLVHGGAHPTWATTRTQWPLGNATLQPGPQTPFRNWTSLEPGAFVAGPAYVDGAPGNWVFISPDRFDARFPELIGMASVAVGLGPKFVPAPAADDFYGRGAAQIGDGLTFVAITSVFVGSVIAAVTTRLELLSRRSEYALLEALGAPGTARRMAVFRAGWTVALGILIGLPLAVGAIAYANRTQQRIVLELSTSYAIAVTLAFALGALLAACVVAYRTLRGDLAPKLSRRGLAVRRFPGPLRFTLITPRLAPVVAVALAATNVTIGVVLGALAAPADLLDPGEGLLLGSETGNPLRGSVPRFAAEHHDRFNDTAVVSPEVFVPTVVHGQPVLVRGVQFSSWSNLTGARLLQGEWPDEAGEAAAGSRAAQRISARLGDVLEVPGAYRPVVHEFRVTAIFSSSRLEIDEILIPLDDASSLARTEANRVHLVRIDTPSNQTLNLLRSPGIQVLSLSITPQPPLEGLQAVAHITVLNTDGRTAERELNVRANGETVATAIARLGPFEEAALAVPFRVPPGERLSLEVNPSVETPVVPANLRIQAHRIGTIEQGLTVNVTERDGFPAPNVTLATPWGTTFAPQGTAVVPLQEPGPSLVTANSTAGFAGHAVYVTRTAWLNVGHAELEDLELRHTGGDAGEGSFEATLRMVNHGGAPFNDPVRITYGQSSAFVSTDIEPFGQAVARFEGRAPYGALTVSALNQTSTIDLEPSPPPVIAADPTVDDVIRSKRPFAIDTAESRTERFLGDLFEAVEAASALVVLATVLHGATVAWVVVRREAAERRDALTTYHAVGATIGQMRIAAARDALIAGSIGIVLGLALTPLLIMIGSRFDLPHAFGHRVPVDFGGETLLRIAAVFLVIVVVAAVTAVAVRKPQPKHLAPQPLESLTH